MNNNTQNLIDQMESRAKELYIQLEGFRDIEQELRVLSKAIKVLKGEKLSPGPGGLPAPATTDEPRESAPEYGFMAPDVLKALVGMPKLSRQRDILIRMGIGTLEPARKRISVMMPYLRKKGLVASRQDGSKVYYSLTAKGREQAGA